MAAYTTFDVNNYKIEIEDKEALEFWLKNFQENATISTQTFTEAMLKKFPSENKKVVTVLCKHIICCSGDANKKDITAQEFDKFMRRFGPFESSIKNSQKVFFKEIKRKDGDCEYTLVRWYHGYLEDCKNKIISNPDKYLVREPKEKDVSLHIKTKIVPKIFSPTQRWHLLTVEYSKSFQKEGKKLLARNKKHLQINRKWVNRPYVLLSHHTLLQEKSFCMDSKGRQKTRASRY